MSKRWHPWTVAAEGDGYEIHAREHVDTDSSETHRGRVQLRIWKEGKIRLLSEGRGREDAYRLLCAGLMRGLEEGVLCGFGSLNVTDLCDAKRPIEPAAATGPERKDA